MFVEGNVTNIVEYYSKLTCTTFPCKPFNISLWYGVYMSANAYLIVYSHWGWNMFETEQRLKKYLDKISIKLTADFDEHFHVSGCEIILITLKLV